MKILEEASKEKETGCCVSSPMDKLKKEDNAAQLELQGSMGSQSKEGRGHGGKKGNRERAMRWRQTVMFKGALPVGAFEPRPFQKASRAIRKENRTHEVNF